MPLRDLFCVLEATETPSTVALGQALALARSYHAYASVLVAGPKIATPYTLFQSPMVGGLVQSENERIRARGEALVVKAQEESAKAGAAGTVELSLEFFQDLLAEVKARALCSDLAVLDRPGGVIERSEVLFEELLFGSGRPVLVATPDRAPAERIGKIALAWDGSRHAARAIAVALGLFADIREADVVIVTGEKRISDDAAGERIAAHIERHGAAAKVVELPVGKGGVAATIDAFATRAGADLIVMGGFGHTRFREFVLGGVTRELSQTAHLPLLLAH